jgi:hypothetical protein
LFAINNGPFVFNRQWSCATVEKNCESKIYLTPEAFNASSTTTTSRLMAIQIDNHPTKQYGTIANILDQGMLGCTPV